MEKFKDGHGRITQYSLVGLVSPKQIAEITNQLQDFFVNETRLGIPVALQSENLCGYPGAGGTLSQHRSMWGLHGNQSWQKK